MTNKFLRKRIAFIIAAALECMSSFAGMTAMAEEPAAETMETSASETEEPDAGIPETEAPPAEPPQEETPDTGDPGWETGDADDAAPGWEFEDTGASAWEFEEVDPDVPSWETDPGTEADGGITGEYGGNAIYSELASASLSYPAADITKNTLEAYRYLRGTMGLNHAAACGVLANIQLESNFNPTAIGDSGTSYGICQWHLGRFEALVSYCISNGLDYHTLEGQLAFMQAELSSSFPAILTYIRSVPDTGQGAYDAAYYWCVFFEAPSNTYAKADQRGKLAREEYFGRDLEQEAGQAAGPSLPVEDDAGPSLTVGDDAGQPAEAVRTTARVNLRREASLDGEFIITIPEGMALEAYGETDGWVKTEYNGEPGYVYASLVSGTDEGNAGAVDAAGTGSTAVTATRANFRRGPSLDGEFIVTIPEGEKLTVLGEENGWFKATYGDEEGYVNANLLSRTI